MYMRAHLVSGLAIAVFLSFVATGNAQNPIGTIDELDKNYAVAKNDHYNYVLGTTQPGKTADAKAARVARACADYFFHRLTQPTVIKETVRKEFEIQVKEILTERKLSNRLYVETYFNPALEKSAKETLEWAEQNFQNDRTAVVHAVMMLPLLGKLVNKSDSDKLGDLLISLAVDDKKHDVFRLYAFKGLKETLPVTEQQAKNYLNLNNDAQNRQRNRDEKYVNALTTYLNTPVNIAGLAFEEYAAKRYVRHHAITALANAQAPAVLALPSDEVKVNHLRGAVSPTLLGILTEVVPGPETPAGVRALVLRDKVEAALGLCNMKHYKDDTKKTEMAEYDPSVATYLVGRTLLEFAGEYGRDLANFKRADTEKKAPYIAFKIDAKRLELGLKELARKENPRAIELQVKADPILKAIQNYSSLNAAQVSALEQKVKELRVSAATGKIFKTVPKGPVIQLPPAIP
jgi:hypothetical protein